MSVVFAQIMHKYHHQHYAYIHIYRLLYNPTLIQYLMMRIKNEKQKEEIIQERQKREKNHPTKTKYNDFYVVVHKNLKKK